MGRTYSVPRNVKGESRLLYIFTVRSFLTTIAFGFVGVLFYLVLSAIGLALVGIVIVVIFGLIGFVMGAVTIPDSPIVGKLRKAGGEFAGDIVLRTITFTRRKKIYVYREGDNE